MIVKTQDFYLTAYLSLKGLEIIDLEDWDNRKLFVFEDNEEYQKAKRDYYYNEALVSPLQFKQKIRELKALIASK